MIWPYCNLVWRMERKSDYKTDLSTIKPNTSA
jgi:hypothetical protein